VSRSSETIRIGELSRRSGVSQRSLRYYEDRDLITSRRAPNGYREYDPDVVERASAIHLLFEMGFSRDVVETVLTCIGDVPEDTHDAVRAQLADVRDGLETQMEKLARTHRRLTEFLSPTGS
jgi:DNA-binding transcriptional MerR regulator